MKEKADVRLVQCFLCGEMAPTTWGFVRDDDEPDNHLAPCGRPCMAGGVPIEVLHVHDAKCPDCTVQ